MAAGLLQWLLEAARSTGDDPPLDPTSVGGGAAVAVPHLVPPPPLGQIQAATASLVVHHSLAPRQLTGLVQESSTGMGPPP